jgi:hypothetical protein
MLIRSLSPISVHSSEEPEPEPEWGPSEHDNLTKSIPEKSPAMDMEGSVMEMFSGMESVEHPGCPGASEGPSVHRAMHHTTVLYTITQMVETQRHHTQQHVQHSVMRVARHSLPHESASVHRMQHSGIQHGCKSTIVNCIQAHSASA